MKYFKDASGHVHAFEADGSQDHLIAPGMVEIPKSEAIPPRSIDSLRDRQIQAINDAYSAAIAPLIRDYPEVETKSWPQQDAESAAYLAWHDDGAQGDPPATPVLDRILAGRNGADGEETMLELCEAVERNAVAFRQAQELTGRRQRLVKAVRNAEAVEAVESIVWPE